MDKAQMQKERKRLQTVLDTYDAVEGNAGRHVSLAERIANLDRKIDLAPEG